ncbi:MAG: aldehyde dehydrogenase (NADP(+)) [Phycisphaerales bacterium JB063]
MATQPILIAGTWRQADAAETFQASNPATRERLPDVFPVSQWSDLDAALAAAAEAYQVSRSLPGEQIAAFLEDYASRIEANAEKLAAKANEETALPAPTRFVGGEIPRTVNQLRQAAASARDGGWSMPTIDTGSGLRSQLGPLGVVCVLGPNNFPFAYNGIAGGDFASAIAAGNAVIAKAHPSHPKTTQMLAELCLQAIEATGMPKGLVQMLYHMSNDDGLYLMADPRNAALGYTGSRRAGLALKKACDDNGKLAYLEMSSVNPVVILPGALEERGADIVDEFVSSCLLGVGQFCTNPGLVIALAGEEAESFISAAVEKFEAAPVGTLLNEAGETSLSQGIQSLQEAGATLLTGGDKGAGDGCSVSNTLMRVDGKTFLRHAKTLQQEAFGNSSLVVVVEDIAQALDVIETLEGQLTGCVYSAKEGADDEAYDTIEPALRQRVGRLLNDKMPTGVAVVASQNHGGPYPATGHPGFTAVGFPASVRRFAALHCYDNVRPHRLPRLLQDKNPAGVMRLIDGAWTTADVVAGS